MKFKSISMIKMLSDILDLHKIEDGRLSLVMSNYDLSILITSVISKLKNDAYFHGTEITTTLQDINCVCDEKKIKQVLIQVITNAIDFTPKGFGKVHVELRQEIEYAKITVKDNGIGINKDNLKKIFNKFYQIDTSALREHRGAGLGLCICKGIVESHMGKIWLESNGLNEGTEVHIMLPMQNRICDDPKKIK